MAEPPQGRIRLDKWLWYARFFKTRGLAARNVSAGAVRLNAQVVSKPAQGLCVGDVLTFAQGRGVRVVEVVQLGSRRGPAAEAQALYADLTPAAEAERSPRAGARPTKKERRALDALRALSPPSPPERPGS